MYQWYGVCVFYNTYKRRKVSCQSHDCDQVKREKEGKEWISNALLLAEPPLDTHSQAYSKCLRNNNLNLI